MNDQTHNTGELLSDLIDTVRDFDESVNAYLDHIGASEVLNPVQKSIQTGSIRINEPLSSGFFEWFGIRRLVLNAFHGRLALSDYSYNEWDKRSVRTPGWHTVKNSVLMEELATVFSICPVVQFSDWSGARNASDLWEGLFSDVIRPLNRKDFQFIFYLGDLEKKQVFEVDEILDIISDYSLCGKVTLILDEDEVDKLWAVLNGRDTIETSSGIQSPVSRGKYLSIFNTMRIASLVIFAGSRTILFSRERSFEFAGRSLRDIHTPGKVKDGFNAGYQLGLLFQLGTPQCIALGLAVSGACMDRGAIPDGRAILTYLKEWLAESGTPIRLPKSENQKIV